MNKYIITLSLNGVHNNICFKGVDEQDAVMNFKASNERNIKVGRTPYPYDEIVSVMDKKEWKVKKFGLLGNPIATPYGRVSKSIKAARPKRTQIR